MEQSLPRHADTSSFLPVSKSLIWFQFSSLALVLVDLFVRYALRYALRRRSYVHSRSEALEFGLDDTFAIAALLPFTVYTVILSYMVFKEHFVSTLFYANWIPLQCALVSTQLSQAFMCRRLTEKTQRLWATGCIILISSLGAFSIAMAAVYTFTKIHTPCGVAITAAMVLDEFFIMLFLVCFLRTTIANRTGKIQFAAWILRLVSVSITAVFGGFYLHTFWSPWCLEVVLCQQINLMLDMIITRGLGSFTAVRQYKNLATKRMSCGDQSQSNLVLDQISTQSVRSRNGSENMTLHELAGEGDAATNTKMSLKTIQSMEVEGPVKTKMSANGIPNQIAKHSFRGNDFRWAFTLRLHNYTDTDLPKLLRETNMPAETWNTPLEAVRLGSRSITLIGTEIFMNIGPRFDTSGIANISITTFNRHLYHHVGSPRNFTSVEAKIFADIWAIIKGRGLTSLRHPHGVESHLLTYEQWGKAVISSLILSDHVCDPHDRQLYNEIVNWSTLDHLRPRGCSRARKENAVEQAEFEYWRAIMNPRSADEELQQAKQRYTCALNDRNSEEIDAEDELEICEDECEYGCRKQRRADY